MKLCAVEMRYAILGNDLKPAMLGSNVAKQPKELQPPSWIRHLGLHLFHMTPEKENINRYQIISKQCKIAALTLTKIAENLKV